MNLISLGIGFRAKHKARNHEEVKNLHIHRLKELRGHSQYLHPTTHAREGTKKPSATIAAGEGDNASTGGGGRGTHGEEEKGKGRHVSEKGVSYRERRLFVKSRGNGAYKTPETRDFFELDWLFVG